MEDFASLMEVGRHILGQAMAGNEIFKFWMLFEVGLTSFVVNSVSLEQEPRSLLHCRLEPSGDGYTSEAGELFDCKDNTQGTAGAALPDEEKVSPEPGTAAESTSTPRHLDFIGNPFSSSTTETAQNSHS